MLSGLDRRARPGQRLPRPIHLRARRRPAHRPDGLLRAVFPRALAEAAGAEPVLALMPNQGRRRPGLAAELMERPPRRDPRVRHRQGPWSSHLPPRLWDRREERHGRRPRRLRPRVEAVAARAQRLVAFDMAEAAESAGSVISAVMSAPWPGPRSCPSRGPPSRTPSATAASGWTRACAPSPPASMARAPGPPRASTGSDRPRPRRKPPPPPAAPCWPRSSTASPPPCTRSSGRGSSALADYQDRAYAATYLRRLEAIRQVDDGADDFRLTGTAARYLALWMSYEDVIASPT